MLVGISSLFSPDLLATIYAMGHGDELVLADAHFPGESQGVDVIRADGLQIPDLLEAILPLFALDEHSDHSVFMMAPVEGDVVDPNVEKRYRGVIDKHWPGTPAIAQVDRFAFYEQAKDSFAIVQTGDTKTYANVIIKKGVTPVQ
jgi:L-fucose mutarotase